ncbi:OmpA family protein [Hymenobacter ruricola]|uniref:OmpA family protein n=1 Tax=Hymenobacter ruricola TaxID=2791023 RepID=A0ABS0HZD3_9BACT|nr:OmpA family protein [Hymenobacter ruricola]MBF9219823.1 OmpA family protein [Hymenobacter ruricola]
MKFLLASLLGLGLLAAPAAHAQFRLPNLGHRLESAVSNRLSQRTDQAINQGLDQTERTATAAAKSSAGKPADPAAAPAPASADAPAAENGRATTRYDFVPGAQVLFEDRLTNEKVGEFPSRWDLGKGSAEVATANGQTVIRLDNNANINPLFKQASYLPAVFTLEMDVFLGPDDRCRLWLWDERQGHQPGNGTLDWLDVSQREISIPNQHLGLALTGAPAVRAGRWCHLALAFNQRSLKAYLDQNRLLNVPNVSGRPTALTIGARQASRSTTPVLLRNVRLAAGGTDLYARLAAEGRLVTHDILFDPGQAVIKPASQPALRQFIDLLQSQPTLRFRIEGHTDADGEAGANLRLSQARAEAVRAAFLQAGIAPDRLSTLGMGETKPLDASHTASAKAQNRRVEFVKL